MNDIKVFNKIREELLPSIALYQNISLILDEFTIPNDKNHFMYKKYGGKVIPNDPEMYNAPKAYVYEGYLLKIKLPNYIDIEIYSGYINHIEIHLNFPNLKHHESIYEKLNVELLDYIMHLIFNSPNIKLEKVNEKYIGPIQSLISVDIPTFNEMEFGFKYEFNNYFSFFQFKKRIKRYSMNYGSHLEFKDDYIIFSFHGSVITEIPYHLDSYQMITNYGNSIVSDDEFIYND